MTGAPLCFGTWSQDCNDNYAAAINVFRTLTVHPQPGDPTGDNQINVFDALQSLKYAVGLYTPADNAAFKYAADVAPLENGKPKGNVSVDVFDALAILRHAVGLDPWSDLLIGPGKTVMSRPGHFQTLN